MEARAARLRASVNAQTARYRSGVCCVDFTTVNVIIVLEGRREKKGPSSKAGLGARGGVGTMEPSGKREGRGGRLAGGPPDFLEPKSWKGLAVPWFCPHGGG